MTGFLPTALGAWMLYLALGILIGLIPRWAPVGSPRYWIAICVPVAFGAVTSSQSGSLAYIVAAAISAYMVFMLLQKKARDGA